MPPYLHLENLSKLFPVNGGFFGGAVDSVKAVQNINLKIFKGETLGVVG